ncbi:DUF2778 domain-containing protein [Neolewinella aurantiaca]|uniref:DUF2778 domain-containing protein n=1 Tax=Neolewinella aurantiaca TaxID=2602767 RepID=A0A5C7FI59_9BACT|nr:RHS repeat-associated core domain-containing protein [Neolewinella aurantiaca]TXF90206.1 DUF2778 domain-containing protein [Neolewinella aurantiaca]
MKPLRPFIITGLTFRADGAGAIQIDYAADYYPYGKILREYKACNQNRYLSTHHERDKDTGYDNRGARLYDSEIGRFLGVDALAGEFPGWSSYNYVLGNPVRLVDPDGMAPEDVIISYNKTNATLSVVDLDHFDPNLSTKYVSAADYVHGGARDANGNLTHNQVLVIENVFSGGGVNQTDGNFETNRNLAEVEIPNGTFDILENGGNTNPSHDDWFRIDAQDGTPQNDQYDVPGVTNHQGKPRNGFRLHIGGTSHGCVTICRTATDDRSSDWTALQKILSTTSTRVFRLLASSRR